MVTVSATVGQCLSQRGCHRVPLTRIFFAHHEIQRRKSTLRQFNQALHTSQGERASEDARWPIAQKLSEDSGAEETDQDSVHPFSLIGTPCSATQTLGLPAPIMSWLM